MAPMEGVVDWPLRFAISRYSEIDYFVTEFMRVTTQVYPPHEFYKYCPELLQTSLINNVPVGFQLLGGGAHTIAANAVAAVQLGARGIDLNFGCPAKTVNRHDGGATLLQHPERIHEIVRETRSRLPASIPLSVKMRLGFSDKHLAHENFAAAVKGGASWITIHGRTKDQMYKPSADWHSIAKLNQPNLLPVFANGDIFSITDFVECHKTTGTKQFMLGRGLLANPFLVREIKAFIRQEPLPVIGDSLTNLLAEFFVACVHFKSQAYAISRMKQWMNSLRQHFPFVQDAFDELRILRDEAFVERLWTLLDFSSTDVQFVNEKIEPLVPRVFHSRAWWKTQSTQTQATQSATSNSNHDSALSKMSGTTNSDAFLEARNLN